MSEKTTTINRVDKGRCQVCDEAVILTHYQCH
jgi:hypothetical protein